MDFKLWLERQFITLPAAIEQQIEKIASSVYTMKNISQGTILGYVMIGRRRIKIEVGNISSDGVFSHFDNAVFVSLATAKNPMQLKEILHHELIHAIDPENTKNINLKINAANAGYDVANIDPHKDFNAYAKQRNEFNAYGSQIAYIISQKLAKMTQQKKSEAIVGLKNWLRYEKFPGFFSWLGSMFGLGLTPSLIAYRQQQAWRQDPKLWRQFKQKMFSFIEKEENNFWHQPFGTKQLNVPK